jgi:hypothetical protein
MCAHSIKDFGRGHLGTTSATLNAVRPASVGAVEFLMTICMRLQYLVQR